MTILRMFDKKGEHAADFNYDAGALLIPADDLRDRFAMAALPAILAATCAGQHTPKVGMTLEASIALSAYNIADAMMEARNK